MDGFGNALVQEQRARPRIHGEQRAQQARRGTDGRGLLRWELVPDELVELLHVEEQRGDIDPQSFGVLLQEAVRPGRKRARAAFPAPEERLAVRALPFRRALVPQTRPDP